jgi:CHAD domain-containing protein
MAMSTHTETERKYEVEATTRIPPLDGIRGVAEVGEPSSVSLEAVYYDTADLRLLRHGATLRRRTGGSDAGWHLKIPTGTDTREELREPLDGEAEPPASLQELAQAMSRGAELRPVARVSTERITRELLDRGGEPLAEVTDDTVRATALAAPETTREWRELEVELARGAPPEVLDRAEKLLRRAGVRRATSPSKVTRVLTPSTRPARTPGTAGEVVLAYLAEQVSTLVRHDVGVRREVEDAVHQMRVAVRRLRSALRVFGRIVDRERTDELQEELRWLGRRLSPARDLEVQEEHLRAAVADLPRELVLGPVAARLTRYFSPESATARLAVDRTLRSRRYRELLDALDALLSAPPLTRRAAHPAAEELPRHVRRAHRKVVRRMESLPEGSGRDAGLHRLRKAAKRFRYAAECAEPVVGRKARRARKAAKSLTQSLGAHQDAAVTRPLLRDLAVQAHQARENGFTFGMLYEQENQRAADADAAFPAQWEKFTQKTV